MSETIRNRLIFWQKWAFLSLFFCLPFSQEVGFGSWKLSLPTEPIIGLLFIFRLPWLIYDLRFTTSDLRLCFSKNISQTWLAWMFLIIPFSSMPLVSLKFWVVSAGHFWVFFIGQRLFLEAKSLVWLRFYGLGFLAVGLFALVKHGWFFDFRADQSLLAAQPFFSDHTLFSAAAAMLLFFCFSKDEMRSTRWLSTGCAVFLLAIIWFSFCRAAWLSVILTAVFGLFLWRKWSLRWLILSGGLAVFGLLFLTKNSLPTADGNARNALDQFRSMTNRTTDASNLERLNRWSCAWRMFLEKPVVGFGPGTFQFQYLPLQKPAEMTRISVTSPGPHENGRGGGTHSEYLQNLAEMGLVGLVLWILLAVFSIKTGVEIFWNSTDSAIRWTAFGLTLGLVSFFLHALVNNFFHSEKVAALIWSAMAWLEMNRFQPESHTL